jgi:hypothetical protein
MQQMMVVFISVTVPGVTPLLVPRSASLVKHVHISALSYTPLHSLIHVSSTLTVVTRYKPARTRRCAPLVSRAADLAATGISPT